MSTFSRKINKTFRLSYFKLVPLPSLYCTFAKEYKVYKRANPSSNDNYFKVDTQIWGRVTSYKVIVDQKTREFHDNESENISGENIGRAALIRGRRLLTFCPRCGAYSRAALNRGRRLFE